MPHYALRGFNLPAPRHKHHQYLCAIPSASTVTEGGRGAKGGDPVDVSEAWRREEVRSVRPPNGLVRLIRLVDFFRYLVWISGFLAYNYGWMIGWFVGRLNGWMHG